jgi:hypothetical protein
MITWPKSVLPVVGIVHCSCSWCLGCNAFMRWVLHAIEVLVLVVKAIVLGLWMIVLILWALSCCVGRVVVSFFDLCLLHPVAHWASALSRCYLLHDLCACVFIVRLCGSTVVVVAFLPKNIKKKFLHFSLRLES